MHKVFSLIITTTLVMTPMGPVFAQAEQQETARAQQTELQDDRSLAPQRVPFVMANDSRLFAPQRVPFVMAKDSRLLAPAPDPLLNTEFAARSTSTDLGFPFQTNDEEGGISTTRKVIGVTLLVIGVSMSIWVLTGGAN